MPPEYNLIYKIYQDLDVTNNVNIGGDLNVEGLIDTDYLTVFQRLNVG